MYTLGRVVYREKFTDGHVVRQLGQLQFKLPNPKLGNNVLRATTKNIV